jgi:DNA-binding HxlR family transcriptional regulator
MSESGKKFNRIPNVETVSMDRVEKERERSRKRKTICMIRSGNDVICVDPSLPIFSQIGKKYTMLILAILEKEGLKKNFNEILNSIPDSSSTIISKRLKELEKMKLLERNERDGSVTYSLTDRGKKIMDSLIPFLKLSETLD